MSENHDLKKLAELTRDLPPLVRLYRPGKVEYMMEQGVCVGTALWNEKKVAVQIAHMDAGSIFPKHSHPAMEWLLVFDGKLNAEIGDNPTPVVAGVGQCLYFGSEEQHHVTAIMDTDFLAVTIPAAEGYPFVPEAQETKEGQGIQGVQGIQGATGEQGAQGVQGIQGERGENDTSKR